MRGTDVTKAQMDNARVFLHGQQISDRKPFDHEDIFVPFGHMVRLVAWYGALRYHGALNGVGEDGGVIVERQPSQQFAAVAVEAASPAAAPSLGDGRLLDVEQRRGEATEDLAGSVASLLSAKGTFHDQIVFWEGVDARRYGAVAEFAVHDPVGGLDAGVAAVREAHGRSIGESVVEGRA